MEERFFVTGALGCIGAWVVRNLVREGVSTTVYDLGTNPHRLQLSMSPEALARVRFVTGDVSDLDAVERALRDSGSTHVIHLAALQVPFCRADPSLGARVNVVGTVNMFEAARHLGLSRLVYASSVAVFGEPDEYAESTLGDDAAARPHTLYGVYKLANEGTARIYWQDHKLASVGLRPFTVYGPGRDQGMTSSPTKAMLAAAAGQAFRIAYGGVGTYQYVDDVARLFIQLARAEFTGAEVYNVGGAAADMGEIVAAIEAARPGRRGQITYDPKSLALPEAVDDAGLRRLLGSLPNTPLADGVAATIDLFEAALADGRLATPAN